MWLDPSPTSAFSFLLCTHTSISSLNLYSFVLNQPLSKLLSIFASRSRSASIRYVEGLAIVIFFTSTLCSAHLFHCSNHPPFKSFSTIYPQSAFSCLLDLPHTSYNYAQARLQQPISITSATLPKTDSLFPLTTSSSPKSTHPQNHHQQWRAPATPPQAPAPVHQTPAPARTAATVLPALEATAATTTTTRHVHVAARLRPVHVPRVHASVRIAATRLGTESGLSIVRYDRVDVSEGRCRVRRIWHGYLREEWNTDEEH